MIKHEWSQLPNLDLLGEIKYTLGAYFGDAVLMPIDQNRVALSLPFLPKNRLPDLIEVMRTYERKLRIANLKIEFTQGKIY